MNKLFNLIYLLIVMAACKPEKNEQTGDTYPFPDYQLEESMKPFYQGVASGDPQSNSVILWTRVTPEFKSTVAVNWKVATDQAMSEIIQEGNAKVDSSTDYTLQVKVEGLQSQTYYYY